MAKPPRNIISNWHQTVEGLQTSPKEFYSAVEQAIQRRQIPNLTLSRVDWKEGGIFSAKREYLRVGWEDYMFDICGAPFGTGFFFSWWLGERMSGCLSLLLLIPLVNIPFLLLLRRETYYRIDTAQMFQDCVHQAVMEVIDQITNAKGVRALTEGQRKPILGARR